MRRGWAMLAVVSLVWAGVAGAAVHQGEIDVELSGTWFTENAGNGGHDFDGLFVSGGIGYFLTDHVEVQAAAIGFWATGNPTTPYLNDQDDTFYAFGAKGKYFFTPKNSWVPYVGGQIFWGRYHRDAVGDLYDADLDGILWGPLAGLRFELTPHNDFFVEYQYHIWEGQISDTANLNSPGWENGHLVTLGLIHRFR